MSFGSVALTGTVETPDGNPVPFAVVNALLSANITDGVTEIIASPINTIADKHGVFSLTVLPNDYPSVAPAGTFYEIIITSFGRTLANFNVVVATADAPTVDLFSLPIVNAENLPAVTYGVDSITLDSTLTNSGTAHEPILSVTPETFDAYGLSASETMRAETAEGVLTSGLSAEITRAMAAEGTNANAVAAELARAIAAEATKASTTSLTSETSRAETAEALLAPLAALTAETARAEAAEALLAPLASPALTGSPTAPTQTVGDNTTKVATDAFAMLAASNAATTAAAGATATAAQRASNGADFADAGSTRANIHVPELTPAACVAATNVASLSGLNTYDGYTLLPGDLVLLATQINARQNGLWTAASGAWTRPTESATGVVLKSRTVAVIQGNVYGGSVWYLQTNSSVIVGTNAQTWVQLVGQPNGFSIAYDAMVASLGPAAWFRLGDLVGTSSILDSSGNGYTGTPTNVTFGQSGPISGNPNETAATLNGTSYIATNYIPSSPTGFSFVCWLTGPETVASFPRIIDNFVGQSGIILELSNGEAQFFVGNGVTHAAALGAAGAITNEAVWHMVAGTYDGASIKVYVDGAQSGSSASLTGNLAASGTGTYLGSSTTPGTFFNGSMGEVAFFNQALTAIQIESLYLAQSVLSPSFFSSTQYNVKDYGAKGDGVHLVGNSTITATSETYSNSGASFTIGDVGKGITVVGAGPTFTDGDNTGNGNLVTTIVQYVGPTEVVLAAAALNTVTTTDTWYGTVCNPGIAAATNAAAKVGGIVYFPTSIYYCTSSSFAWNPATGVTYKGDGVGSVIYCSWPFGETGTTTIIEDTNAGLSFWSVESLLFDGGVYGPQRDQTAILIFGSSNVTVKNCVFRNFGSKAVQQGGGTAAEWIRITDNFIYNAGGNYLGISGVSVDGLELSRNWCQGPPFSGGEGILTDACAISNFEICDNIIPQSLSLGGLANGIVSGNYCIGIQLGRTNLNVQNVTVKDNIITGSGDVNFAIDCGQVASLDNFVVSGNVISGTFAQGGMKIFSPTYATGIVVANNICPYTISVGLIAGGAQVTITGNVVPGTRSISLAGASGFPVSHFSITGNSGGSVGVSYCTLGSISGNATFADGTDQPVCMLLTQSSLLTVGGNTLDGTAVASDSAILRIGVSSGTDAVTGCLFTGNRIYGTGSVPGVFEDTGCSNVYLDNYISGTSAPMDLQSSSIARGNFGYNPKSVTTPSFPATTVTYTNNTTVDVWVYITNGTGSMTTSVNGHPGPAIPASALVPVFIPAGGTFTPTFGSGSPVWVFQGN